MKSGVSLTLSIVCLVGSALPVAAQERLTPTAGSNLQATRTQSRQAYDIANQSPEHIVRLLEEEGKVIALPTPKGTIKHKIDKYTRSFMFPTGQSHVAVVRMPEYRAPYTLKITSLCHCLGFGLTKSVFVPSGLFLDAGFRETRELAETQFETHTQGMTKGYRLEANIQVVDLNKDDRFLLLYTNRWAVGKRQGMATGTAASGPFVATINLPVE